MECYGYRVGLSPRLGTCSRRKEGNGVLWEQSSVFLDKECLAIKLTRSQLSGFCCLICLGGKSLLFQTQVIRFAEDSPGGCLRPNFAGNGSAHSQESAGEIDACIKAKGDHFECAWRYVIENFFVILINGKSPHLV
ncbi:hypothetical protein Y032_0653g1165 [Ancylostoma ceylanicum]|uniref:Uncharacterized protein n=1 Tax=Ancylostoma ceylanicum TaxID=53326 RepID=A0A016WIN3_9BILA|nr:hypothetical protein Y032_0653g1165 [Ancylostoma ceylanicum]